MVNVKIGNSFGKALCEYFALPASQVSDEVQVNTKRDEMFSVSLTIMLTADDLAAIAKRMGAGEQAKTVTIVNNTSSGIRLGTP